MPDDFTVDSAELAGSARINFETVAKQNPGLARHPIWLMAMMQLQALEKRLNGDD